MNCQFGYMTVYNKNFFFRSLFQKMKKDQSTNPYILCHSLWPKVVPFLEISCFDLCFTPPSAFSIDQCPLFHHPILRGCPERMTSVPVPYNIPPWHPQLRKSTVTAYAKSKAFHHSLSEEKIEMIQLESHIYFWAISVRAAGKAFLVVSTCPFLYCAQGENSHRRCGHRPITSLVELHSITVILKEMGP